jgi:hypothetical protein
LLSDYKKEELNKFQTSISPIFEKIKLNSEQIQTLTFEYDQLLPKLIN